MTGPKVGFFSGFMPVDAILSSPPKWSVVVNDTDPIFYYCSALGSCLDYGMVGVVNPNASVSLQVQKDLALNSTFMLQPGEPWPPEASSTILPTTTATVVSTAASTPTSGPAETTSEAATSSSHHTGLSTGAIAGIAIGGAAVLLAAGFLVWWCGRQSRRNHTQSDTPPTYVPPQYTTYPPMSPSAKHISGVKSSPVYPSYPYTEQPNMGPFGVVQMTPQHQQQAFYIPQSSPGHAQTSPLMGATGQPNFAEVDSMRGASPSPPPGGTNAGIAAFLERNGRMSPSTEGQSEGGHGKQVIIINILNYANSANSSIVGPYSTSGPYEMSAGGAGPRGP